MSRPREFKKSKSDEHMDRVFDLLFDYGPHTSDQVAEHLGVSRDRAADLLNSMRHDGSVTVMHRAQGRYWILKEDALAA